MCPLNMGEKFSGVCVLLSLRLVKKRVGLTPHKPNENVFLGLPPKHVFVTLIWREQILCVPIKGAAALN